MTYLAAVEREMMEAAAKHLVRFLLIVSSRDLNINITYYLILLIKFLYY